MSMPGAQGEGQPGREGVARTVGVDDGAGKWRSLERAGATVSRRVGPSVRPARRDGHVGRPAILLARIARTAHERVEGHVAAGERVVGPGRRDQGARRARRAQRPGVAAGEVHAVHLGEAIPWEVVLSLAGPGARPARRSCAPRARRAAPPPAAGDGRGPPPRPRRRDRAAPLPRGARGRRCRRR